MFILKVVFIYVLNDYFVSLTALHFLTLLVYCAHEQSYPNFFGVILLCFYKNLIATLSLLYFLLFLSLYIYKLMVIQCIWMLWDGSSLSALMSSWSLLKGKGPIAQVVVAEGVAVVPEG